MWPVPPPLHAPPGTRGLGGLNPGDVFPELQAQVSPRPPPRPRGSAGTLHQATLIPGDPNHVSRGIPGWSGGGRGLGCSWRERLRASWGRSGVWGGQGGSHGGAGLPAAYPLAVLGGAQEFTVSAVHCPVLPFGAVRGLLLYAWGAGVRGEAGGSEPPTSRYGHAHSAQSSPEQAPPPRPQPGRSRV